jgi:cytochrome c556
MKITWIAGAALFATALFAQDHAEFKGWMKSTGGEFSAARKGVAAKQGPETAEAAEKLAGLFAHVADHFKEDKMEDGVKIANEAEHASKSLAEAAKAGDWDKASAEVKTIGGSCQSCHAAHREKLPDGSFKMK